ncbi:MAG: hypothetical protein QMB65_07485 [Vicingaceae bacterium]
MNKVLKIIFVAIAGIVGLAQLFNGGVVSFVFMLLSVLLLVPSVLIKIQESVSFLKDRKFRVGTVLLCFIIGMVAIKSPSKSSVVNKKDLVFNYIVSNKNDKSLSNIRLLAEMGDLFGNEVYTIKQPRGYIIESKDSVAGGVLFVFNPKIDFESSATKEYLKELNGDYITDYELRFIVGSNDSIISKKTIITFENQGLQIFNNSDVPEIQSFIDSEVVELRKIEIKTEKESKKFLAKQKKDRMAREGEFFET